MSLSSESDPIALNRQRAIRVALPPLESFLRQISTEVAAGRAFSVCLVSDAAMRRYNKRFRGKDAPTDVLSFPAGDALPNGGASVGDIAISVETARRQARRLGHPLETELRILALHGLLHLLGFDHEAPRDAGRMARTEQRWRRRFQLPHGLIERSRAPGHSGLVGRPTRPEAWGRT